MGVIRLAGLFVLVVVIATWVLFASSILDAIGNGGRAAVLQTVEPTPTLPPTPTPVPSPTATATAEPSAPPTATATATATPQQTYTIARGDNLTRIADAFGVTLEALMEANGINDPSRIREGQVLVIPPAP
jgi:LysM repeat protein